MSDDVDPAEEAPIFKVSKYGDVHHAIRFFGEKGVVIVDFRAADTATRLRVADFCRGAGTASGSSPFRLADGVFFLTTRRLPTRAERQKFRADPG